MNDFRRSDRDGRRWLLAGLTVLATAVAAVVWWASDGSAASSFVAASAFRIAVVLGCLWMAWPSLKRPMDWLPAGVAGTCLIGLMVIAARPRLVVLVVPLVGLVGVITSARRWLSG